MGLALIRTDPSSSRHHGLSVFAVPLSTPGVEVRPIRTINDAIEVNEVFLTGVELSADSLIGEIGQGWSIIMAGLDFERFGIGGNVILLELMIDDLVTLARGARLDGAPALSHDDVRQAVAELAVEVEVAKSFIDDHVERMISGREQVGDGSIAKLELRRDLSPSVGLRRRTGCCGGQRRVRSGCAASEAASARVLAVVSRIHGVRRQLGDDAQHTGQAQTVVAE